MPSPNDARFANAAEVAAALDQVSYLADTGVATAALREVAKVSARA